MNKNSILIVDDEESIREVVGEYLSSLNYKVFFAEKLKDIKKINNVDIVLLDAKLPDANGIDSIKEVKDRFKQSEIIIITAFEKDAKSAVKALKNGAFDYLVKPFKFEELSAIIEKALDKVDLKKENERLKDKIEIINSGFHGMIGLNSEMRSIYAKIEKVAQTNLSVLIEGESGTGKELCANAIHTLSGKKGKFITINCAAIPNHLLESELFGYEKGAFSGAVNTKKGLFEEADKGSVFLDEIGDMPLELQSKLLRFLENMEIKRLGDNVSRKVEVRIISATNKNLEQLVEKNLFREDLYYRLNGFVIKLPALRFRKEDIPILVKHFLNKIGKENNKRYTLKSEALKALLSYDYPGNIRELKNILQHSALMSDGTIACENLPDVLQSQSSHKRYAKPANNLSLGKKVEEYEKEIIVDALKRAHNSKTKAAEILGITFRSIRYKIAKYKIEI